MENTWSKVVINPGINENDRQLLADMLEKLNIDGEPDRDGAKLYMTVTLRDWSALYVLEDFDILRCKQI
jgi:hypothetical protein